VEGRARAGAADEKFFALRAGTSTWHWGCLCVPGTRHGIAVLVIWWILTF